MDDFDLLASDPGILGGKPCVRGTRLSVQFILELVASGGSILEIVRAYPVLTPDAVEQAIRYAARFLENEVIVAARVAS